MKVQLNGPQGDFLNLNKRFKAFVCGYGGGKTWVGCTDLAYHFLNFPNVDAGYFAPTYPQIRDIFYPTVAECLEKFNLRVRIVESTHEVFVYRGKKCIGKIICRSMDNPKSIVGFKIGKAVVYEIDVMPMAKAMSAWRKIIARMRYKIPGLINGIDVTSTPEGFRFVYEQFVKQVSKDPSLSELYGIIQASTYDNEENLPDGYIDGLRKTYPSQLIDAYIDGQFVNLTSGTVYRSYKKNNNQTNETLKQGEVAHVGMDFNVGKMAAVIHVIKDGMPYAVDEIVGAYDTPDMIRRLQERLWLYKDGTYQKTRQIRIYPDASGDSRRSVNASKTDLALLKEAGFVVSAPKANPPVKDRINAMNAMFCNANEEHRYFVNVEKCPSYAEALEQQSWAENGEPDKTTGHDHVNDAAGYFIVSQFPVVKRSVFFGNY